MIKLENKKGWLKIVEAFVAIMLILATLLILLGRQESDSELEREITLLQTNLLSSISKDDNLREEILTPSTPLTETNGYISKNIPSWLDYKLQVCEVDNVCALTGVDPSVLAEKQIYSQNILILATAQNAYSKQLKLFFWRN